MKKLLIVMSTLYNGGAEKSLVNFLNELPEDKYEIDLLLFKREGMFLKQVPEFVTVLETPEKVKKLYGNLKGAGILMPVKLLGTAVSKIMSKNFREQKSIRWKYFYGPNIPKLQEHYDVAMAYISGEILYYLDEKVEADRKIVWIHNDYKAAKHPRKYDYPHLKNMDYIVSISDMCVNILKDEFPEFADKIGYLPNITSSTVIHNRAEEFYPVEFEKDCFNILSIGRLSEQKGFDMAIEAVGKLKDINKKFKWYIIGNGELKDELQSQIDKAGLQENVVLLGTRDNPYPYIKNCSLFVQPSRYEGKSVVLDEAKILGVPIMATNYPTVGDQLINGTEGIIVDMSSEGIAQGIKDVLEDKKDMAGCVNYLNNRDYGNQSEITLYYDVI